MVNIVTTFVVNIKKLPKWWKYDDRYVYIGRPGKGLYSEFGNPFVLTKEDDRDKILEQYKEWLEKRVTEDLVFKKKVIALDGKILVCFCSPKKCHGDVLVEMVKKLKNDNVETVCHLCGSKVQQSGIDVGQCVNPKCKVEHTVINPLPNDELTDCQYKDFYG